MTEELERLEGLVVRLRSLFATDFLGATLLAHRIGRAARVLAEQIEQLPDTEERAVWQRRVRSYTGYGF